MKTILQKFIDEKIVGYHPPLSKREGGLSAQKYKATLLFLTNDLQENIAKKIGVSFGLLRKWRTEKQFLDTIEKHYQEFLEVFLNHLAEFSQEPFKDLSTYNPHLLTATLNGIVRSGQYRTDTGIVVLTNLILLLKRYISEAWGKNILECAKEILIRTILARVKTVIDDEKTLACIKILENLL